MTFIVHTKNKPTKTQHNEQNKQGNILTGKGTKITLKQTKISHQHFK